MIISINCIQTAHPRLEKGAHLHWNLHHVSIAFRLKVNHLIHSGLYAEKTARNYLNNLCEMQVMEKKVIEGKHYYLNIELYRILSE